MGQGQLTDTKDVAELASDELRGGCSGETFRWGELTSAVAAGSWQSIPLSCAQRGEAMG